MKQVYIYLFAIIILFSCATNDHRVFKDSISPRTINLAKYEPADSSILFFIGQDMNAIGGLSEYNQGYCDNFNIPVGITLYTNLTPGSQSYGSTLKGLDGLNAVINWGAGDTCGKCYLENKKFNQSYLSIGLSLVDHEKKIAHGKHDALIKDLGNWIKKSNRPVFLRIGYEFDGWSWNHYIRKHYLESWKRIHAIFSEMEIDNVAFVWQSKGSGSDQALLESWYPGDDLVDWCAYSYFGSPDKEMITFARRHNKPVFIAEATPTLEEDGLFFNTDLSDEKVARHVWKEWFIPFLKTIEENKDVIKAFSYINTDWSSQFMWINNPVFNKVDSRLQESPYITKKWKEEMSKGKYFYSRHL